MFTPLLLMTALASASEKLPPPPKQISIKVTVNLAACELYPKKTAWTFKSSSTRVTSGTVCENNAADNAGDIEVGINTVAHIQFELGDTKGIEERCKRELKQDYKIVFGSKNANENGISIAQAPAGEFLGVGIFNERNFIQILDTNQIAQTFKYALNVYCIGVKDPTQAPVMFKLDPKIKNNGGTGVCFGTHGTKCE